MPYNPPWTSIRETPNGPEMVPNAPPLRTEMPSLEDLEKERLERVELFAQNRAYMEAKGKRLY